MTATLALAPPPIEAAAVPVAASTAVADLITGRRRPARVVASTRHALLLTAESVPATERPSHGPGSRGEDTAAEDLSLVCLSGPQAVRLPCALLLPVAPPTVPVGTPGSIGGGLLRVAGLAVRVGRWWKPSLPRIIDSTGARQRAATLALPPLERSLAGPAQELAEALHSNGDLAMPVRKLLGLGCGLTPGGDDVIAGALVALHAAGAPTAGRLAATVNEASPQRRTTLISAGLLRYAARGEGVPELAALLAALDGRGQLSQALHRLLAVGHTSGTALCHGAVLAVAGLRAPIPADLPATVPAQLRTQPARAKDLR